MIHHVVGLFTHPDQEWKEIRGDQEESISHMYLTHTLILAAIPPCRRLSAPRRSAG